MLFDHIIVNQKLMFLIDIIYSRLVEDVLANYVFLRDRIILSTWNGNLEDINEKIIVIFSRKELEYISINKVVVDDGIYHNNVYPIQFLKLLNPSRIPRSRLCLKIEI